MSEKFKKMREQLGAFGKTLTLPFASEGVPSLLYALREKRLLRSQDELFKVVAADYDKYYDEVIFLFDYSTSEEEIM